ncbi:MAG: xanthine dehydrogenase family protein molybdopterin-binding subunit [Dehalococcoidia bacterium]|nr:xanthine dehydrogenase family protein molybdopterin-binding subunit [Dehalococcoidia bacterium]
MATTTDRPAWRVVGTRPVRHDGTDKVTGRAKYGADVQMAGLLHGKVLRSPYAHARIKRIDTRKAEAHPGVRAVVTWKDFPPRPPGTPLVPSEGGYTALIWERILATDKVLYKGHPIAAIAAISSHVAEEALALIEVEYEVLPAVLDGVEAMKEGAPLLHDAMTTKEMGHDTGTHSNVASHEQVVIGDVEKGFREADVVVEREFRTAWVHQGYIEPQNATAHWDAAGHITLWSSSQGAFDIRRQTAEFLRLPVTQVTVMPVEVGGGFGGKVAVYLEPVAALLSRKANHQPVKMVMTRTEVFEATGPTSGSYLRVKVGATKNGRITATQGYFVYEAGAFPGSPLNAALRRLFGPYAIENYQTDGYDVVVNKLKASAYRAPGLTNAVFASEQVLDEVAEKIGMDPMEFRLKNALRQGGRRTDGTISGVMGNVEVLQATKDSSHYNAPLTRKYQGRGVASGAWGQRAVASPAGYGSGDSSVSLSINPDGSVNLTIGSVDIGGHRAAIAMHAAEVLEIPAEDVHPLIASTDGIGYTRMTVGSGTTVRTGWAAFNAAQEARRQLVERIARIWQTPPGNVAYADGVFLHKADPVLRMSFKELAGQLMATGGGITVGATNTQPGGGGESFSTHVVDVEVDPETGKVEILRYTALQDVGQAVHPSYAEGQMQGGVAQGIGWALNEEYYYNAQGVMTNSSFLDYRMPTSLDLPMLDTILVEVPNPDHPFGVRGVGEPCIVPVAAAIANAIHQAIGVRMTELPMSPARILQALWEKSASEGSR